MALGDNVLVMPSAERFDPSVFHRGAEAGESVRRMEENIQQHGHPPFRVMDPAVNDLAEPYVVNVCETTVALPGFDGWRVNARLERDAGQLIVTEVRVYCDRWWEQIDNATDVPNTTRRVTTTVLDAVSLREIELLANVEFQRRGHSGRVASPTKARHRTDLDLARWARSYADLVASGDARPNATLAKRHRMESEAVAEIIRKCRGRELLTRPSGGSVAGRAGGELTPKAIALLEGSEQ